MADKEQESDVNEVFDNLLFAEENAVSAAFAEGYEIGRKQSIGYHLGYHRASLLAAQLGYYSGILEQYLTTKRSDSEKVNLVAREVLRDIYEFPKTNDETVDILNAVDDIKSKYVKFCSLAKINPSYPEADKLNF